MAKLTCINKNQQQKVIFLTVCFLFAFTISFSQIKEKDSLFSSASNKIETPKSVITDSMLKRMKNAGGSIGPNILSPLKNSITPGVPDLMGHVKKEITGIVTPFKNPVVFHSAWINSQGSTDSSYLFEDQSYYRNNTDFASNWSVAGIPLGINFQQQSWSDFNSDNLFQFSFQFDREQYLDELKKRLKGKIDVSGLADKIKNPLGDIIARTRQALTTELQGLSSHYKGLLDNEVNQIGSLQSLFTMDLKQLQDKFLDISAITTITEKQRLLSVLQQQKNNGEKINEEEFKGLEDAVLKMKGVQELLKKVQQHKTKWEQSGLLRKIKEFDLFKQVSLSRLLNNPATITKLAREKLSLSSLQRLFLNVTRLNIGQNALSSSPLSFQHFLSKGVSTELLSNKRSLQFLTGKQTDFNSILDYPFSNTPFSANGTVKSFGIGTGQGSKATTNFSIASFSQSLAGLADRLNPSMLRQVLVTTISNRLAIGEKGMIQVELSRSATQYNQEGISGDSVLRAKNSLSRILSTDNFMGNTAISLKYADEFAEQGLSYHFSFNKTANGYTNPGNSYLATGSTEIGTGARKLLLKSKLVLSFRGNTRIYKFNEQRDASWMSTNFLLDAKWKMKKGQYIALRYQPVKMVKRDQGHKVKVSSLQRVAVDASVYKKIGKLGYRNFFSLSGQKNTYSLYPGSIITNNSLTISSFQHLLIAKKMFYINLNYNHTDNLQQFAFLNSSLYTESGYSYQLTKSITASSGLLYTSTKGWYNQVGIRQTVSGQLGEKMSINVYVDMKKNLKVLQPLWDEPIRADISLRYVFKNKD